MKGGACDREDDLDEGRCTGTIAIQTLDNVFANVSTPSLRRTLARTEVSHPLLCVLVGDFEHLLSSRKVAALSDDVVIKIRRNVVWVARLNMSQQLRHKIYLEVDVVAPHAGDNHLARLFMMS